MMWAAFDSIVFMLGFLCCWQLKDGLKAWMVGPEQTAVDSRLKLNTILIAARNGRSEQ